MVSPEPGTVNNYIGAGYSFFGVPCFCIPTQGWKTCGDCLKLYYKDTLIMVLMFFNHFVGDSQNILTGLENMWRLFEVIKILSQWCKHFFYHPVYYNDSKINFQNFKGLETDTVLYYKTKL